MFCGNCGNKIEDNAKFCPVCVSPQQTEAPVQEAAQELPVREPAPVQSTDTAVNAPEEPVLLAGDVPAHIEPEIPQPPAPEISAQPAMPAQPELPAQPEIPVQTSGPVPQGPAAPASAQAAPAQSYDYAAQTGFAPAPEAPKKKKSKAPLIAGVTAAAVVAGGAGVGYFCFHDDITRMFMGDKEYAKMIDKSTFKNADKFDGEIGEYAGKMSPYLETVMKTSASYENGENENSSQETMLLQTLDGYFGVFENGMIPEGTSLETESTVNVQLGSVFALADNETTRSIIDAINSSKITAKIANGETDLLSGAIIAGGQEYASGALYSKDGNVLITLPNTTDKTLFIPKEKFDSVKLSEEELRKRTPDINEIKRIREEIAKIYYDGFDTADIEYTDNSVVFVEIPGTDNTVSAKGNLVSVTFTGEQLDDMLKKCREFLKNDEYLKNFFNEAYGIDSEKYEKLFKEPENEDNTKKQNITLNIDHLVDVHNNVLATRYKLISDDGSGTLILTEEKKNKGVYVGITAKDDISADISLVDKTENGKDGKAVLDITVNRKDADTPCDFRFDCEYTGKGTVRFIGDNETPVGKYVVTLSEPDKFVDSVKSLFERKPHEDQTDTVGEMTMSGSGYANEDIIMKTMSVNGNGGSGFNPDSLINELKKLTITSDTSVEGDVLTEKLTIALGDIGTVEFGSRSEKKNETVTMPDTSDSININDEEGLEEFGEAIAVWAESRIKESGISDMLGDVMGSALLGGIGGQDGPDIIGGDSGTNPHYAAYTPYMEYEADNTSFKIYDSLNDKVKDMLLRSDGLTEGKIKLYYKDGKPEVLENYGFEELTFEDIEDIDSVYAEVLIDNRFSRGIVGVTTVFTDDKNDLPFNLPMPSVFNYHESVYPWETTNMIGDYIVGTYPYVYTGEPTSTEYPLPALSKNELDNYAYNAAGKAFELLDGNGSAEHFDALTDGDFEIEFACYGSEWVNPANYGNSISTSKEVISTDFITFMLSGCRDITNTFQETRDLRIVLYFKDGKLVGSAAIPGDSYVSIEVDELPKADDFKNGIYDNWNKEIGDGYLKYYEDTIPIGTYSVPASRPLVSSENATDPNGSVSYGIDGTWRITAIDGKPYRDALIEMISEFSDSDDEDLIRELFGEQDIPDMLVIVSGNKVRLGIDLEGDVQTNDLLIKGQGEYEGKTAYELVNNSGDHAGWFIPGATQKTAQLKDTVNDMTMDIEWLSEARTGSEGLTPFGAVKSEASIDDIAGKWHAVYNDDDYYMAISTNYVAANAEEMYYDSYDYIMLNPRDDGFDGYIEGESPAALRLQYSADTDTLSVTYLEDNSESIFERTEKVPARPAYLGEWKVSTVNGQSIEEWAKQNDFDMSDVDFTFSIGEYAALYTEDGTQEIWTVFPINENSFNLAYDSSMFLEMKLSANGDEIIGTLRLDDSNETMEYGFRKIS